MSRLVLIERWPGWRRLLVLFGAGLMLAVGNMVFRDLLTYTRVQTTPFGVTHSYHLGAIVSMFVIVPIVLAMLSLSEQRPGRAVLEAIVLGGGLTIGLAVSLGLSALDSRVTVAPGMLTLLCVLFRLATLWVVRNWFRHVMLRTGLMCWTCGYDLTGNTSGVCPECGKPICAE